MGKGLIPIKKESYEDNMLSCCSDGQHYPYGTSLHIEDDLIDDLGVNELVTDDKVEIMAVGFVNSKNEYSRSGGDEDSKSMGIQITELKIRRKPEDDPAKILYGG